MCVFCLDFNNAGHRPDATAPTRRDMLRRLSAIGLSVPLAALSRATSAADQGGPPPAELLGSLEAIITAAKSPELLAYRTFAITADDLPWRDIGLSAGKGQQVTFLLGGRLWLSREYNLWFAPGLVFHARSRGTRPMYNPMTNTGTMIAAHDGAIEVARSAGEWADDSGALWTPEADYKKADVSIVGIALLWRGDAAVGLKSLVVHGDVADVLQTELSRLESTRVLPEGWSNFYMFGGGPVVFSRGSGGEIECHSQNTVGILERPTQMPLLPGTRLGWRWMVESLPSMLPENQPAAHDYLSIGVKFDDGQDLTYLWSQGLPEGKVFRCPLPRWTPIETHMVIRSGGADLGKWLVEERDIHADYTAHIGGSAKAVSHVWLLAVTVFQRRLGACRYADIQISNPGGTLHKL
jgi:hypothetical protein